MESTNLDSSYKAEVEEYWVSPEKWRRTIHSPGFSQTLIVNGEKVMERDSGDYYPFWLRNLVTAIFNPLPMAEQLAKTNSQIDKPAGGEHSQSCARFESKVGTPPAQIGAFSTFCFEGSHGLLDSVTTPSYGAQFKDYKSFKDKRVARRIVTNHEPGTTIQATITELSELTNPDERLFTVQQEQWKSVQASDSALRGLSLSTPDIVWPSVRAGKTSGSLSMYVSVDRTGHVREAWPLNSDNANLDDAAREQVRKWQFTPATENGEPVQVEAVLVFAFDTKVMDTYPALSDEEARKLATKIVEPVIPAGVSSSGTSFTVHILVGEEGKVHTTGNPDKVTDKLFLAASTALRQWTFRPYLRDGKPDMFTADIVFLLR